ncbi:ATP-binding cassette domain-containing protein [Cocleimonas sp. KMM 6892]|uniref:ABC transporter ATP-binding protein n=1 Tax=unclassified Cocleimonas TaxID=2639732 RepID=UPI002DBD6C37|nr:MULTISPECIES: ATP-binding cassette domain-containing protein [unclassified Cocleimonas]MEB8430733.1 ATP-binding cassette domain-containing protein [Cocleimonas sp. KMM 6892]MEC4714495.1 ATP-binding cassette domain-containing protein [Cocleimonas sp. KMM 6895]MEC4743828.1 ATP-binding cassette domain-containing protein [Cocleimonas sp. KMM 6896]
MSNNSIVIESQNLSKSLPVSTGEKLHILNNISLVVEQGESVAITGTSGSGKTTLLGLLAGLDVPSEGKVSLLKKELTELDEDQRAALRLSKVGFVFQSFHLMDNLTALENVMLPLELDRQSGLKLPEIRQRASEALNQVGLGERLTHLPTQLSGGEQQRVALARAFVTKPSVLFADEPTGNLDSNTGDEIIELLFAMQKESNTTLVLVTHDDDLAEKCQTHYKLVNGVLAI